MPLPTMTASAPGTSARLDWAWTTTPFIDVTIGSGQQRVTRQPGFLMRLRTPKATNESSSLKPWKVRMAMCMAAIVIEPDRGDGRPQTLIWLCLSTAGEFNPLRSRLIDSLLPDGERDGAYGCHP